MHYNKGIREVGCITEDEKDRYSGSQIFFIIKKGLIIILFEPIMVL